MIVLCTGMIRSGSTWSFNVVKMLLKEHSDATNAIYSDDVARAFIDAGAGADHIVIKAHTPDHMGRFMMKHHMCKTVYTYRNPLDSFASGIQSFSNDFDSHLAAICSSLDLLAFQAECQGVHFIWYDEILDYPEARVAALAEYLGLDIKPERIAQIARMFERENVRNAIQQMGKSAALTSTATAKWDIGTWFSSHHIRAQPATPRDLLTEEQIAQAIEKLGQFVDENGELLELVKNVGRLQPAQLNPRHSASMPASVAAMAEPAADETSEAEFGPPVEHPAPEAHEPESQETTTPVAADQPVPAAQPAPAPPAPVQQADEPEIEPDIVSPAFAAGVFVPPVPAWPDGPPHHAAEPILRPVEAMLRPIEEHRPSGPPVIIIKEVVPVAADPASVQAVPAQVGVPATRVPTPRRRNTQDHDIVKLTRNTKIV